MNKLSRDYERRSSMWDARAGVRTGKETFDLHLTDTCHGENDKSWHLPNYAGILEHEDLRDLPEPDKEFVRGTQLLEFVSKQTLFEVECVNKVAAEIAHGKTNIDVSDELRNDALKIYTDEGYHAYYTQKLALQIQKHFNVSGVELNHFVDPFYAKIEALYNLRGTNNKKLSRIGLVIAGECQIVSDISDEMRGIVHEPIREMFKAHMADEVFHANFFSNYFQVIWGKISHKERFVLAASICDAIRLLSAPRTDVYYYSLGKLGYGEAEIKRLISAVYHTDEWRVDKVKRRARPMMKLLSDVQAFSNKEIRKYYEKNSLFDTPNSVGKNE